MQHSTDNDDLSARDLYDAATLILDTAHDMKRLIPASPYSMSSEQLRISSYLSTVTLAAVAIRTIVRTSYKRTDQ